MSTVRTPEDWVGLQLSKRYDVKEALGEGGMAYVYRAFDREERVDVVIKVPKMEVMQDPGLSSRFTREICSLAKLSHPRIIPLTDVGKYSGIPFAVVPYLSGGNLRQKQRNNPLDIAEKMPMDSLTWLQPIARALDFIHDNGFIHRDVHPGNIMFNDEGRVFLSDFGIAKAVSAGNGNCLNNSLLQLDRVLGTPNYMAPELCDDSPIDGRADQYSLAVTVYEMLCGNCPYEGSNIIAILVQLKTESFKWLHEIVDVPQDLSMTVARALSVNPAERFSSCGEFAASIVRCVPELQRRNRKKSSNDFFKNPELPPLRRNGKPQFN